MKVADAFGNELMQGDVVAWEIGGSRMLARVEKLVVPGGLVSRDQQDLPGKMVISVEVPLDPRMQRPSEDFILGAFIKTVDPREKALVAGAVS